MSGTAEDVLRIARSQIGVTSGRKYFEEMGDAWWGQAYCARFGRWVYWKADVDCHWPYDVAFDERDVPQRYRVDKHDLQPADPLCFDWMDSEGYRDGKGDHFGIVESVQDWGCVTIEGNTNGGKVDRQHRLWDCIICGIRPTYANGSGGKWVRSGERWWWQYPDGDWPKSEWKQINDAWYYFDANGWMATGWVSHQGKWYWCDKTKGSTEGQMLTSTCIHDGTDWYALGSDGAMLTGSVMTNPSHDGTFGRLLL